jgi:hypothetical protein
MVNLLEEIKERSRQTTLSNQERLRGLSAEDLAEKITTLRDSLLDAPGEAVAFFTVADIAARLNEETEIGAYIWKETRTTLSNFLNDWQNVEKIGDPQINGIVEHYCKVLRDLVEQADQEYRSYSETAYLLGSKANAERLREANEEADSGNLPIYDSAEDFFKSLLDLGPVPRNRFVAQQENRPTVAHPSVFGQNTDFR